MMEERIAAVEKSLSDVLKYLMPLTEVQAMKAEEAKMAATHALAARDMERARVEKEEGERRVSLVASAAMTLEGSAERAAADERVRAFDAAVELRKEGWVKEDERAPGVGAKPVARAW